MQMGERGSRETIEAIEAIEAIDPADMLLFARVVREGSFAAAARSHGVTRQSVSERMARLEAHLGVRLTERTTRSMRLTDAGALYHARCVALSALVREANAEVRGMQHEPAGLLRVSAPKIYGRRYLVPIVAAFLARYPRVRVELMLHDRRVNLVEEGFDLAIRVGELSESSMIARRLGTGRVHYVASPAFVAEHDPQPHALADARCICLRAGEVWTLDGVEHRVDPVLVVNDLGMACDAAMAGVGIAQVPSFVDRDAVRAGRLQRLFASTPALERPIYAVFPSQRHLAPKVRHFVDAVADHAREAFADDEEGPPSAAVSGRPRRVKQR